MYKIEYKTTNGSIFSSLHIDDRKCHSDAQKFAQRCNELEVMLKILHDRLPESYASYLEDLGLIHGYFKKWMTEEEAIIILGGGNLNYFIEAGELGYSMEGDDRLFDRWEVFNVKKLIRSSGITGQ